MMVPLLYFMRPDRGDGEASWWHAHVRWLSVVCIVLESETGVRLSPLTQIFKTETFTKGASLDSLFLKPPEP